jgi:hypothetical protein
MTLIKIGINLQTVTRSITRGCQKERLRYWRMRSKSGQRSTPGNKSYVLLAKVIEKAQDKPPK